MFSQAIVQISECFERLDIIIASNIKVVEQNVRLKQRLVRRNGEKSALYEKRKSNKK